jgi:hypothetical protein
VNGREVINIRTRACPEYQENREDFNPGGNILERKW